MGILAGIGLSYFGAGTALAIGGGLAANALTGGKGPLTGAATGILGGVLGNKNQPTGFANVMKPAQVAAGTDSGQANAAAVAQRKKTISAQGRGSTIKTGPQGLGEVMPQNLAPKSLLGY